MRFILNYRYITALLALFLFAVVTTPLWNVTRSTASQIKIFGTMSPI